MGQNENGEPILKTLRELGISRAEAFRCRMMAAVPKDVFEELMERPEGPPSTAELVELGRRYDRKEASDDQRFKLKPDDPADAAWQIAKRCTPGYVAELIDFLREYLGPHLGHERHTTGRIQQHETDDRTGQTVEE